MTSINTINLDKGQRISLDKAAPGLKKIIVGLGWRESGVPGVAFDLDASALMLNAQNRVGQDHHFIFYNAAFQVSPCGSVRHSGDNLSGAQNDEECEQISINLETLPESVKRIVVAVTIYKATERGQSFGQVRDAFAQIKNEETGETVARYNLTHTYDKETALEMLEIYRYSDGNVNEWRVGAIGQGYSQGLNGIASRYGLDVTGG
ncbi:MULTISPECIES: TerD family protein [Pseudomonas]|uniref:TerD family protein n=1 Tax=Pseudomonas TaxID=286 RepID=UPI000B284BE6|nr:MULTISPECIES: TerD family protein [Pseudomonas]MDT8924855.1 TerD family protein [Pseudomonas taiwanensis]